VRGIAVALHDAAIVREQLLEMLAPQGRRQPHHAVLDMRPAEFAALQPLGEQAQAGAVPEDQLHSVSSFGAKQKITPENGSVCNCSSPAPQARPSLCGYVELGAISLRLDHLDGLACSSIDVMGKGPVSACISSRVK